MQPLLSKFERIMWVLLYPSYCMLTAEVFGGIDPKFSAKNTSWLI